MWIFRYSIDFSKSVFFLAAMPCCYKKTTYMSMVVCFRLNMSIVNATAELKFRTLSFIISGTTSYQDRWMEMARDHI